MPSMPSCSATEMTGAGPASTVGSSPVTRRSAVTAEAMAEPSPGRATDTSSRSSPTLRFSSSGVPSAMTRPESMTVMRSAR
jgi:hypothetical protein